jgi:L-fucose isomerase-like protein
MTLDAALMSDIERDTKDVGEKMKAGAKAAGEKISDTGKDMEEEAKKAKEKVKEKVD